MATLLDRRRARLERTSSLLSAFSYREVLRRGFALVRDGEGHPLHAATGIAAGTRLDIEFADGRLAAVADGAAPVPSAPAPKPRRAPAQSKPAPAPASQPKPRGGPGSPSGGQGSLF